MNALRLLARPEARRLLLASFVRARSALELSEMTGIPIAKCYRLLRRLRLAGLVGVEALHVTPRGRVKPLFRARLTGLQLFLKGRRLMGRITVPHVSESPERR